MSWNRRSDIYVINVRKVPLEKQARWFSAQPTSRRNLCDLTSRKRKVCIFHKIMTHAACWHHTETILFGIFLYSEFVKYKKPIEHFLLYFFLKTVQRVKTQVNTTTGVPSCSQRRAFCFASEHTSTLGLLIEELWRRGGIRTQRSMCCWKLCHTSLMETI